MNITLTGASGFLGNRMVTRLLQDGHRLHVLGRKRSGALPAVVSFTAWNALSGPPAPESIAEADAVIHLAGEPVSQRWNPEVKRRIQDSRELGTKYLVEALAKARKKPEVLVSTSATGFYGDRGDETLSESSAPASGFLPEVCVAWEREAAAAAALGIRVPIIRLGIVLGKDGGALPQMLTPFRLGVGGRLGSGQQWMSWIHVDDLVELFVFAMNEKSLAGPMNGVSPIPVRNADFTRALAQAVHRPAIFPVPRLALKLVLGDMADIVLGSQRVIPTVAEKTGFPFKHTNLDQALANLLR